MIFVKLQNGNVKVTTAGGDTLIGINDTGVRCMVVGPSGDIIQIMQDNYPIFTFNVSEVSAYQILPAASVAFAGTAPQFVDILMADFFLAKIDVNATGTISTSDEGTVDTNNSTFTPLLANNTYTGTATDVQKYASVVVACLTDQVGTLQVQFSTDNVNWDSTIPFPVAANTNEVHRITVTRRYMRVRFVNGAVNQTFLRLQTIIGKQTQITSALNSTVQQDSDTLVTRPLDFNLMVARGLYEGHQVVFKEGVNNDIDTGSTPEDVWSNGGIYTGFPLTAAAAEIVVVGADTGTVFYNYLASPTDTDYTIGSIAVAGAGTYALGHNVYRSNFAYFDSGTVVNVGQIYMRHTATPANIFWEIETGVGQTRCSAYTVPANTIMIIDRVTGNVRGSSTGYMDGEFYYREYLKSPRLRYGFELQFGSLYFDDVDYLITPIPALTDLIPRITASSANNLSARITVRYIKIKS